MITGDRTVEVYELEEKVDTTEGCGYLSQSRHNVFLGKCLMKLSSIGSRIIATLSSNGATVHTDPTFLGWTAEPMETLVCKKLIKGASIDKVILEIPVLHMKNHFMPSLCI